MGERRGARFGFTALAVFVSSVFAWDTPALAAAGDLDPTFSRDGKVITNVGEDGFGGIVAQPDGKVVVAGTVIGKTGTGCFLKGRSDFLLLRYTTDGGLDRTFGDRGRVRTDFGGADDDQAFAVALQPDGKILVAGQVCTTSLPRPMGLARYNSDGTLDTSFGGGDGKVTTSFGSDNADWAVAIALQSDGKIVVTGYGQWDPGTCCDSAIEVARYNSNGSPDSSFGGGDGQVTYPAPPNGVSGSVVIQTVGGVEKIVVLGSVGGGASDLDFLLLRYNLDGTPDTSFGGGDGVVTTDFPAPPVGPTASRDFGNSLVVQTDGKLVAGGNVTAGAGLARYNVDGSLDATFGTSGMVNGTGPGMTAMELRLDSSGRIVVAGSFGGDFALGRYDASGSPDATFSTDGRVTTDFGAGDAGLGVTIAPGGALVVGGETQGRTMDIAVARYAS